MAAAILRCLDSRRRALADSRTAVRCSQAPAHGWPARAEARRMIQGGGVTVNEVRIASADAPVPPPIAGEWLVVRIGKRKLRVGRLAR